MYSCIISYSLSILEITFLKLSHLFKSDYYCKIYQNKFKLAINLLFKNLKIKSFIAIIHKHKPKNIFVCYLFPIISLSWDAINGKNQ